MQSKAWFLDNLVYILSFIFRADTLLKVRETVSYMGVLVDNILLIMESQTSCHGVEAKHISPKLT